jgi:ubiquinone biosynthesis accessory factor UbiJ
MALPQSLIATLETACNKYLSLDNDTLPKLEKFEGKIIAIEILGINEKILLYPSAEGIMLLSAEDDDSDADTVISGTPMALAKLGASNEASSVLFAGEVRITGDTRLGHQFKNVLQQMHIDWEEHLSRYIGDMAAHQAGNAARDFSRWWQRASQSLHLNMGEYLQEESQLVVGKAEINRFVNHVDELRDAIDRIEARFARLR